MLGCGAAGSAAEALLFSFLGFSAGAAAGAADFSFFSVWRAILGKPSYAGSNGTTGGSSCAPLATCDMCEK